MTNNDTQPKKRLPNHAFDSEYNTQYRKEMLWLKDRGINPVFIKKVGEYNIPTYKYTKTAALFRAVADFYDQKEKNSAFDHLNKQINAISYIVNGHFEDGDADGSAAD